MADKDFEHASLVEGLRFTAQVAVPNLVQGLFRRRRAAVAVATKAGVDGLAIGFLTGLRRRYGDGPLWIRLAKDEALLLLGADAARRALDGSPDPFAADPEPKRKGMAHFQPDALTISRSPVWEHRRRFTEAVLDTHEPAHRLADRFVAVCEEETSALIGGANELEWDAWNSAVRRVTRRIVLGDGAGGDDEVSQLLGQLMDEANGLPSEPSDKYALYTAKIERYVEAAQEGSLVSLFADAPLTDQTKPAGQVTHWLFAMGDTLAINAFRCLALLVSHSAELARAREQPDRLDACLQEAMRLWPTTPMLSRETVNEVKWDDVSVPAGTQLVIVNTFNHRDRSAHELADRFVPEQWISGDAGEDWSFNHLSHGPQACPGAGLALLVGKAMLGKLLLECEVALVDRKLDPDRPLPHMLDFFGLRFSLAER